MLRQRGRVLFTRMAAVAFEEPLAEFGCAEALEVHGQEGHVGQHVSVAEPVVELDAVEDVGTILEAEDVFRLEVAVAVVHAALINAAIEQTLAAPQVPPGHVTGGFRRPLIEDIAHERRHLGKIGLPIGRHRVTGAGLGDHGRHQCTSVEADDRPRHGVEVGVDVGARGDEGGEVALGRHAAHDDEMVTESPVWAVDIGHSEVHVRRQPAVELDLTMADGLPGLPGGKVEKSHRDRLLGLVGPVPTKNVTDTCVSATAAGGDTTDRRTRACRSGRFRILTRNCCGDLSEPDLLRRVVLNSLDPAVAIRC